MNVREDHDRTGDTVLGLCQDCPKKVLGIPCKTLSLVNLAPDIVEELMSDPPTFDFSVKKNFSHRLPVDRNEQRKLLGLPEKDYAEK